MLFVSYCGEVVAVFGKLHIFSHLMDVIDKVQISATKINPLIPLVTLALLFSSLP